MKRILVIASLVMIGVWPHAAARAQAPAVQVISGTVPISVELKDALETFLNAYPPSPAPFYAPTYLQELGTYTVVSLAGLDLQSPEDPWQMETRADEPRTVVWIGSVRVYPSGSAELVSANITRPNLPKMATILLPGPGGSASIRLPFQTGKSMQYGPRLVHGLGDYGTSGMYAVDLVGGDSLGTNVASDTIFASAAGTVDYVCTDGTSVAIRTHNSSSDDTFVYAHLLSNSNLTMSHVFAANAMLGALKHGGFSDTCGWAEQGPTIYHVHWMFEPSGGSYAVGGYTILLSDKKFHTSQGAIGSGGWLSNSSANPGTGTGTGTGADDPGGATDIVPSFWDPVVAAIVGFVTSTLALLPDHNSASVMLQGAFNAVVLFFRLTWVLVRGNLNLTPIMLIAGFLLLIRVPFAITWLVFFAIRVVRVLKQTFDLMG